MHQGPTISDEDGPPRSREVAELFRRIAAVRWFPRRWRPPAAPRVVAALREHEIRTGLDQLPAALELLSGSEGRQLIARGEIDLSRRAWVLRLQAALDGACNALRAGLRAQSHPLFQRESEALMIRPTVLPVSQPALWRALQGEGPHSLEAATVRILIDRILWELGAAAAWELAADLLEAPNPFAPLLTLYEEGIYPLDLNGPRILLWAPAAPEPTELAGQ
jgi:hypothetical protein